MSDPEPIAAAPRRRTPATDQRNPPGCRDPDWCRRNGCYWGCVKKADCWKSMSDVISRIIQQIESERS